MQPVDARITVPATPYRANVQARTFENVVPFIMLCAFWGTILFLALNAALH